MVGRAHVTMWRVTWRKSQMLGSSFRVESVRQTFYKLFNIRTRYKIVKAGTVQWRPCLFSSNILGFSILEKHSFFCLCRFLDVWAAVNRWVGQLKATKSSFLCIINVLPLTLKDFFTSNWLLGSPMNLTSLVDVANSAVVCSPAFKAVPVFFCLFQIVWKMLTNLQCLKEFLPKSVWGRVKQTKPPKKAFSPVSCYSE